MLTGAALLLNRQARLQDRLIEAAREAAPLSSIRLALMDAAAAVGAIGRATPSTRADCDTADLLRRDLNALARACDDESLRMAAVDLMQNIDAARRRVPE